MIQHFCLNHIEGKNIKPVGVWVEAGDNQRVQVGHKKGAALSMQEVGPGVDTAHLGKMFYKKTIENGTHGVQLCYFVAFENILHFQEDLLNKPIIAQQDAVYYLVVGTQMAQAVLKELVKDMNMMHL